MKRKIFPINYLKQIERMKVERADSIKILEFKSIVQTVGFLLYPAVRLQEEMRSKVIGEGFWVKLGKTLSDWESKKRRDEQIKIFEDEALKKKMEKVEKREKNIKNFWGRRMAILKRSRHKYVTKADLMKRGTGRRASDTYIFAQKNIYFEDLKDVRKVGSARKIPAMMLKDVYT